MKKTMIALMAIAAFGVSLLAVSQAEAATTAAITVTVTIRNLSVAVSPSAVAFGTVPTSSNNVSTAVDVTNDGNVTETYTLQLTGTDLLTVGETETAAALNTFVLQALFQADGGTAAVSGDFGADTGADDDVVKAAGGAQTASASVYAWTGSTDNGAAVPATTVLDLYFKYSAPTSDTATAGVQEELTVTITATAA